MWGAMRVAECFLLYFIEHPSFPRRIPTISLMALLWCSSSTKLSSTRQPRRSIKMCKWNKMVNNVVLIFETLKLCECTLIPS